MRQVKRGTVFQPFTETHTAYMPAVSTRAVITPGIVNGYIQDPLKYATTTRYYDCQGGSCGCGFLINGIPVTCPWEAFGMLPNTTYEGRQIPLGTAAASDTIFGEEGWMGPGCGDCYLLKSTGIYGGTYDTQGTTENPDSEIIVKVTNKCPDHPTCPVMKAVNNRGASAHFDIAVPAGGQGAQGRCDVQYPGYAFKDDNCSTVPEELQASCEKFKALGWNNPIVEYTRIPCPSEFNSVSCSVDAAGPYAGKWPTSASGCLPEYRRVSNVSHS